MTLLGTGVGNAQGNTFAGFLIGAGVGILSAFFFAYLDTPNQKK